MTDLMHVSLFAGVGGADLGFHAAGIPTVAAVEIDDQARGVLAHRFPDAALFGDIREVTGDDLRDAGAIPGRTIISGGFPCQPFSVAGRRGGMGGDERGDLWWEIHRLLAEFRPRWLLAENVPGLLSIDGGRTMGTILGSLGGSGYGFCYRVLDAQWFGVPQRRRRVFIVGRAGDDRGPVQVLLEPEGGGGDPAPRGAAGPGAAGGTEGGADLPPEVWAEQDVSPTLNVFDNNSEARATVLAVVPILEVGKRTGGSTDDPRAGIGIGSETDPMFTLQAGAQHAIAFSHTQGLDAQPSEDAWPSLRAQGGGHAGATSTVRRLTPTECERLMGWPDGHTSHRVDFRTGRVVAQADSSRYRQCGNGMAAPVVEWIARRIVAVETSTEETA